jgi:hypothetical protein
MTAMNNRRHHVVRLAMHGDVRSGMAMTGGDP